MRFFTCYIFFLLLLLSSVCNAQLITWNFKASISHKLGSLPEISIGDVITGSITFISNTKNSSVGSSTEASYRAIDNIRLNIANIKLISKDKENGFNKIVVRNDDPIGNGPDKEDAWFFGRDLHDSEVFVNKLTPMRISFFFLDKSASAFDSLELPVQPLDPLDFTNTAGSLRLLNSDGFMVVITLDEIIFTPDLLAN